MAWVRRANAYVPIFLFINNTQTYKYVFYICSLPIKLINMQLFEDDWGVDESPPDNTEITTTILYFSKEELAEFKAMCKKQMKKVYGADVNTKANLSDFLLTLLKTNEANGNIQTKEDINNPTS